MQSSSRVLLPLVLLAALAACDPFAPRGDVKRKMEARTAEAPLAAIRTDTMRIYDDETDNAGDLRHNVWYSFEVDGQVREDSIKPTLYVEGEQYKVCYDPQDPDNSSIQLADLACGKAL